MEPLSGESGNPASAPGRAFPCSCFNGAALRRERKLPFEFVWERDKLASMEPLSGESGNAQETEYGAMSHYRLQWSRSPERAETPQGALPG